jgi:hypothetical protein
MNPFEYYVFKIQNPIFWSISKKMDNSVLLKITPKSQLVYIK